MKNLIKLFAVLMLLVCKAVLADVTFVHTDVLGSPVAETNSDGQLVRLSHYKPFGEELEQKKDDVAYTGHKYDAALGLIYMQARYYDPVIGRFYSNDPLNVVGHINKGNPVHGVNRYAYGNNNPYRFVDPTGLSPEKIQVEAPDVIEVIAKGLGFENASDGNQASERAVEDVSKMAKSAAPSRETVHTTGSIASVGLTIAAVTTPCTVACANGALAISTAMAVDNISQGKYTDAALNMLPAGAGKATTVVFKGTKQISKAQAGAIVDSTTATVDYVKDKD